MRRRLAQLNVALPPGDSGSLSSHGFSGAFAYDEGAQSLEVTIHKYPLFAPKTLVWRTLDDAVAQALDQRSG
jgi:hypothetical protein